MPKARFTSLDLRCVVRDIQKKLVGLRVANVYDLESKTYLLKLAKPDSKVFLIIENGIRIHSTGFSREHSDVPSVFTLKLRKAIRAKRLEKVTQYGFDRVIDLQFGSGEAEHHVICEFYAGGNIVLTDASYKILALLRTYKSEDGLMNVSIGATYPTTPQQQLVLPTPEQLNEAIKAANPNTVIRDILAKQFVIGTEMIDHCLSQLNIDGRLKAPVYNNEWTTPLIASFQQTLSFAEGLESQPGYVVFQNSQDRAALSEAKAQHKKKKGGSKDAASEPNTDAASSSTTASATSQAAGAKTIANSELVTLDAIADRVDIFYENFVPLQFAQYAGLRFIKFADFDTAVDEYYSKVEGQKVDAARLEHERSFDKRIQKVKEDNENRIKVLEDAETRARGMGTLIEQNAELVDAVIKTINGFLARQTDWAALNDLVKQEKKKGNPLASVIHKLSLKNNKATVLLYPADDKSDEYYEDVMEEEDQEEEEVPMPEDEDETAQEASKKGVSAVSNDTRVATAVEVDLGISAYKNSEDYFDSAKRSLEKRKKTEEAAHDALKRAEKKVKAEQKEVKVKASIQKLRSPYWFEKFNWFITSEDFIVVSGRDAQQNEMLYKRYLAKGDVYVHADIHGASTCIIKNPTGAEVPPRSLTEAGNLSVCHSSAWKSHISTSAWWVEESQVSKTAPTGEYLSTGSFMIRGKKNFLPPSPLVMGFGILFRLADESVAAHVKETTDDDIRAEKERKHHERDLQDQIKHAGDAEGQETLVDLGGDDDAEDDAELHQHPSGSDGEGGAQSDEPSSTTANIDSSSQLSTGTAEEVEKHVAKDEGSDVEDKPTTSSSASKPDQSHSDEVEDHPVDTQTSSSSAMADSKFALDIQHGDIDEDEAALLADEESASTAPSASGQSEKAGKKYMSKAERARLKKAHALGVDPSEIVPGPKSVKKAAPQEQPQQQGKKKKKTKREFVDEEERQAFMTLTGANKATPSSITAQQDAKKSGNAKNAKTQAKAPQAEQDTKQKLEARKQAQAAKLAKDKEEEEIRQLMKDEKLEQLTEEDLDKLRETSAKGLGVNLSALTGRPRPGDVLLYAMAVCAPYDTLSDYKYKIKITPGTVKKGKSAKLAVEAFVHVAEATDREKELIRAIPDAELGMTMISNAKLQMAGLNSMVNKKK